MTDALKKEGAYWKELARHPTGSRFICDPPVLDSDDDWVILVEDLEYAKYKAARLDWYSEDDGYYRADSGSEELGPFVSLRHSEGSSNYIFTDDAEFYDRYVAATLLAKKHNLLNKVDRIQLFHTVLYGEYIDTPVLKEKAAPASPQRFSEAESARSVSRPTYYSAGESVIRGISPTGIVLDDMLNLVTEEERAIGREPEIRRTVPEFDWIANLSDPLDSRDTLSEAGEAVRSVGLRD